MHIFLLFLVGFTLSFANTNISPNDSNLRYIGRWDVQASLARSDWPGTGIHLQFEGSSLTMQAQGLVALQLTIDGEDRGTIVLQDSVQNIVLAQDLAPIRHNVKLYKRSESINTLWAIHGFTLSNGGMLIGYAPRSPRRIEFIGDSYTVGYGMESPITEPDGRDEDSLLLMTTNSTRCFAALVAKSLGAEFQITAMSGRGLAQNYNGINPEQILPKLMRRTLVSDLQAPLWDFSHFHPQVIVIGLGINDFQGDLGLKDSLKFDNTYHQLLEELRSLHPGVQFILCATKVWPLDQLKDRVQTVITQEQALGNQDIQYFEYSSENNGYNFHPSSLDHENIANQLRPLVARAGRWLSR